MKIKSLFTLLALVLVISGCTSKTGEYSSKTKPTDEVQAVQNTDMQVRSTFNKTVVWSKGQQFMNVIGSTNDPKIDNKTWIAIYKEKCKVDPGTHSITGQVCSNNALGGHVVKNGSSQYPGVGDTVYIAPICTGENNAPSLVMTVAANSCAVVLNYWK